MDSSTIARVNATQERPLFDLGWDYFAAKQGVPDDAHLYPSFLKGYAAAKERLKPVRGDRFELKWLQLRYGAVRRLRAIDEKTINPLLIKCIDTDICPITLMELTHSTGTETDWSVDRVSNDIGYTICNLVVVSTKANLAKGSMSYADIVAAANSDFGTHGLSPIEWKRWQCIASFAIPSGGDEEERITFESVPFVTKCPMFMPMNPSSSLQLAIAKKALFNNADIFNMLIKGLSRESRISLNKLLHHTEKHRLSVGQSCLDVWFIPSLFNRFKKIYDSLPKADFELLSENMEKHVATSSIHFINNEAWDPSTKGYARSRQDAHI